MKLWTDELTNLPEGLSADDVRMVLAEHADLTAFPGEGTGFTEAELPAAIAKLVRQAWHSDLAGARLVHLFKQKLPSRDDCHVAAYAQKSSPLLLHLAEVDFVIVYSWEIWKDMPLWSRLAVIHHELCHCRRDDERGWITVGHDIEEFASVARRFGPWQPGITTFREQLDMFNTAGRRTHG